LAGSGLERAHLNLVDSSRLFYELDPGAAIEAEPDRLFGAGSAAHPVISQLAGALSGRLLTAVDSPTGQSASAQSR
jgi:hypothetical protein